jgi:hypothetical protein
MVEDKLRALWRAAAEILNRRRHQEKSSDSSNPESLADRVDCNPSFSSLLRVTLDAGLTNGISGTVSRN